MGKKLAAILFAAILLSACATLQEWQPAKRLVPDPSMAGAYRQWP